jgi:hypothetical protein
MLYKRRSLLTTYTRKEISLILGQSRSLPIDSGIASLIQLNTLQFERFAKNRLLLNSAFLHALTICCGRGRVIIIL